MKYWRVFKILLLVHSTVHDCARLIHYLYSKSWHCFTWYIRSMFALLQTADCLWKYFENRSIFNAFITRNFVGRQTLYSDRLCSDRRYSDNLQSGRPSTSLAWLGICRNSRNWEEIGMGRGIACIESTALIEALRWLRGAQRSLGRVSQWVWGAPSSGKVTINVLPTQLYCPWFSGFGSASFQSVLPVGLFNCSQPPDVQTIHGLSE